MPGISADRSSHESSSCVARIEISTLRQWGQRLLLLRNSDIVKDSSHMGHDLKRRAPRRLGGVGLVDFLGVAMICTLHYRESGGGAGNGRAAVDRSLNLPS